MRKSNYEGISKNIITLLSGSIVAQALPIAISPILTRLYTPSDFGILALFVSVTAVFGSIANGRYELAIMLPSTDEEALNVAVLGVAIAFLVSLVLAVGVHFTYVFFADYFNNKGIGYWLYFSPIVVFFLGVFNSLNYLNTRLENYSCISRAHIYRSISLATTQVSMGFLRFGSFGLIFGNILSAIVVNANLLYSFKNRVDFKRVISRRKIIKLAIRYKDFPKYSLAAILANTLSQQALNVAISVIYSVSTLGYYSLMQRVLGMPTSLIGTAVSQVFFKKAAIEKSETGKAIKVFNFVVTRLLVLSILVFALIYFFIEDVFSFVFGEDWVIAGQYAKIMIPYFAVRFVVSAVTTANSVFEKQKISLIWQIGLLILSLSMIVFSAFYDLRIDEFLLIYSSVLSLYYLVLFVILYLVVKGDV